MPTWLAVALSRIRALLPGAPARRRVRPRGLGAPGDADRRAHPPRAARPRRRGAPRSCEFGGPMQIKEQQHDRRGLPLVETTLQDLRYGLRALRRNPAYALVGDCDAGRRHRRRHRGLQRRRARSCCGRCPTAIRRASSACSKPTRSGTGRATSRRPPTTPTGRARNTVFTDIAAYEQFNFNGSGASEIFLTGQGEPQGLKSLGVTGNLFSVLGAPPLLGRTFTDEETFEGKARVDRAELRRSGRAPSAATPAIIGRAITLSGRTYDVVGVMPRDFFFPGRDVQILAAGRLSAIGVRPGAPAALSRRRRAAQAGACRCERAQQEMDAIAREPRKAVSRHEHADGRAAGGLPRQPGLRTASGAADAERRRRPAVPDRLREHRQPPARARDRARARAGDPPRARRRTPAPGAPAADRVADRLGGRRRARLRARHRWPERRCSSCAASAIPLFAEIRLDLRGRAVLRGAVARRAAHLRRAAGADVVARRSADRARRGRVARHALPAQHADRRRGRAVDRARRRRGAARAQPRAPAGGRPGLRSESRRHLHRCRCRPRATPMPPSACARSRRSSGGCGSSRASRPPAPSARSRCAATPGAATPPSKGAPRPTTNASCATSR